MNIDQIMKELAEYIRMGEQIAVTSSRIDTSALKRDMPTVAAQYSRTTETRRFTFS